MAHEVYVGKQDSYLFFLRSKVEAEHLINVLTDYVSVMWVLCFS